ncbi:MAG: DUF1223 domain-containing protein [Sphingopyxis sp.]
MMQSHALPKFLLIGLGTLLTALAVFTFTSGQSNGQSRPPQPRLAARAEAPVLVELFTSQGCSSCPPADAVLAGVTARPDVVAISRHVTYWDRLGWRDTLGNETNSALQRAYAARGVAGGEVYTPQAVVNGRIGLVGSHAAALSEAIVAAGLANPTVLSVAGGRVSASTATPRAELRFIAIASRRDVRIIAGENGGRRIAYHNVVLAERSMACPATGLCGAAMPAELRSISGADRFAAVLQNRSGGAVLAARWLPIS